nr:hypothetical protein [Rhodoferax sp.]
MADAATMSKDEYKSGKASISAHYKADKPPCAVLATKAKVICVEEVRAKERVARAELEDSYSYSRKATDQTKARAGTKMGK